MPRRVAALFFGGLVWLAGPGLSRGGRLYSHPASFIRGDADASGAVDLTDAFRVLGYLFLGDPPAFECFDAADADESGAVDISDGIAILTSLFVSGAPLPAPYPLCGYDPTDPDGLDCGSFAACILFIVEPERFLAVLEE